MVIGDGQSVGADEEAAGIGGVHLVVDLLLRFIQPQLEGSGEIPVRHLPGSQFRGQQTQGVGGGSGADAEFQQPVQHGGVRAPIAEVQSVIHGFRQVSNRKRASQLAAGQANAPGEGGGIGDGKVPGLVAVAQHPQQHGAPGVCI